jgi:predicted AAA+ superfamily ATPase
MFARLATSILHAAATTFPVVTILGARQVGKTTLARTAFPGFTYLDLEDPRTAERFRDDARFALDQAGAAGLILDEAQAVPQLFPALRGAVDANRAVNGRFVLLGSAQPALVRGVAESLAGRVAALDLDPLTAGESNSGDAPQDWRTLWLKGGFPDALRGDFRTWWDAYLRMLLERDLPQYGVSADPVFMRRLLTMLAHQHGGLFNASALGASLGVSYHVIQRQVDVLEAVFLVRRLAPWFRNVGKRLTKAPKVYLRDSGLLHHLLNISTFDELFNHPARGASWEGFVIEDVLRRERIARPGATPWFWRTAAGAEVDLIIDRGGEKVALEIKAGRGGDSRALRTLRECLPDIGADRAWFVDQSEGILGLGPQIARAGFAEVQDGTP